MKSADRMQRALQTALPPEVAARLIKDGGQGGSPSTPSTTTPEATPAPTPAPVREEPVMRVVRDEPAAEEEAAPEPAPVKRSPAKAKPEPARRTRSAKTDLGELDLGERIRQITTRMPISLADRLDIAVLRQKRTGGELRSIQSIMLAGAERVLEELESDAA